MSNYREVNASAADISIQLADEAEESENRALREAEEHDTLGGNVR